MSVPFYVNPINNIIRFGFDLGALPAPIFVSSTAGMQVGDTIEIMLDNGELFRTTIKQVQGPTQIVLTQALPYFASAGNIVIDITQAVIVPPSRAELSTDLGG